MLESEFGKSGPSLLELEYHGWVPWTESSTSSAAAGTSDERQILFVNTETITQITEAMERLSKSAALVLFNLPPPDYQARDSPYGIGIRK